VAESQKNSLYLIDLNYILVINVCHNMIKRVMPAIMYILVEINI